MNGSKEQQLPNRPTCRSIARLRSMLLPARWTKMLWTAPVQGLDPFPAVLYLRDEAENDIVHHGEVHHSGGDLCPVVNGGPEIELYKLLRRSNNHLETLFNKILTMQVCRRRTCKAGELKWLVFIVLLDIHLLAIWRGCFKMPEWRNGKSKKPCSIAAQLARSITLVANLHDKWRLCL